MDKEVVERPEVVERVNVALIAEAALALAALQERTGKTKVDIINRALQVYGWADAEQRAGNRIIVRDSSAVDQVVTIA